MQRGGRTPGPIAIAAVGVLFLLWLAAASGPGWVWNVIFGPLAQPSFTPHAELGPDRVAAGSAPLARADDE